MEFEQIEIGNKVTNSTKREKQASIYLGKSYNFVNYPV